MEKRYAGVCLIDAPHCLDREFDYRIPEALLAAVRPGSFVAVGFGKANRPRTGLVVSLKASTDAKQPKELLSVSSPDESMDEAMLGLVAYLKEQTLCTTGDAARAMVPSGLSDFLSQTGVREETYYRLAISAEEAKRLLAGDKSLSYRLGSKRQGEVLSYLLGIGTRVSRKQLAEALAVTKSTLDAMCARKLLLSETEVAFRGVYSGEPEKREIVLSEEQAVAFEALSSLLSREEGKAALLYGVTGSGKTSVILRVIDRVLMSGRGAIVLLPEIALTPQTLRIFSSRYGREIAVMHSGLSNGERCDAYRRCMSGEARIVIGTRSAVFAPVRDLGLIVIDEEQEHTYKSDMSPKYHARDVARYRCAKEKALLLLASATPSLESYQKAKSGAYHLVTLENRYGNARLPEVSIIDMRKTAGRGENPFSEELASLVAEKKERGEQSILFLNRRGYHHAISCRACGEVLKCDRCSISMTYHTTSSGYDRGELVCHLCGLRKPMPKLCPTCGSEHLARLGYGTQRVEQQIAESFPSIRLLRMDTDTTGTKSAYDRILGAFREGEADLLLGTQMVTKGHDFSNVTLVGVLNADSSLYVDDYRAGERTFAMLTQVIGRAGRSDKKGLAVIQTANPDSEIIRLAAEQDYPAFYEREIALRRLLVFPPFVDIVLITLSGREENEVQKEILALRNELLHLLEEYKDVPTVLFGPFEAPIYRAEGRYRMRLVVKCRLNKRSRTLFAALLDGYESTRTGKKEISPVVSIDFNPSNL